jgi:C1A family cysteine protease
MKNLLSALFLCLFLVSCTQPTPVPPPPPPAPLPPGPVVNHSTGYIKDKKSRYGKVYWRPSSLYSMIQSKGIPQSWDSREHGGSVPIYNQGSCGSCWAFGTTTTMMINYQIASGQTAPQLSPQAIVSCDNTNNGCGGGNFAGTYCEKYGLPTLSDYPYTGTDSRCNSQAQKKTALKPNSFVYLGAPSRSPTEDEVNAAIFQYGAVAVSAGADNSWEAVGKAGILTQCNGTATNHEITAVAYDSVAKSITIQNSWGSGFGANGYMTLPWGCDNLTEDAGYFVFDVTPIQPIKVHLPAEYIINAGDDLTMAVKPQASVNYQWLQGTTVLGTGPEITVSPLVDTIYNLIAKNSHGEAEIQTLVTIRQ